MVGLNPQPLQTALVSLTINSQNLSVILPLQVNGYVVSFIVRNTGINATKFQECVYSTCLTGFGNECKLIEKCYIIIAQRQGVFEWFGKLKSELHLLKTFTYRSVRLSRNLSKICMGMGGKL